MAEKPYAAVDPEPDVRMFIVIDICGRPKSVKRASETLLDEIWGTVQILKELQGSKHPAIAVYQPQVEPGGSPA